MGGHLWQLSFQTFDGLTAGAFSDHRKAYEETAPVFFNFELDINFDWIVKTPTALNGAFEAKVKTNENDFNDIGFPLFKFFKLIHEGYIDPLWSVLLLASPTSHIVQPRHSITFITLDDPNLSFELGGKHFPILSFRGDMDIEYVFRPKASGKPIEIEDFYRLPDISQLLQLIKTTKALDEALDTFKLSNLPYLNRTEQLMITVAALESLMLPNIYSGLKRNFSARIASLLAKSEEEYNAINRICRKLYDFRSKAIHGKDTAELLSFAEESQYYFGAQLLASCIISFADKVAKGQTMETVFSELDGGSEKESKINLSGIVKNNINDSPFRLLSANLNRTATYSPNSAVATPKGQLSFWCPLIGLNLEKDMIFKVDNRYFNLTTLNGNDVVNLEDKDIRRDFISRIRVIDHQVATLQLSFPVKEDFHMNIDHPFFTEQAEIRNLLTIGLRLAGYTKFIDPELLGGFAYHGYGRYRQASVLRQSILTKLQKAPVEHISEDQLLVIEQHWKTLVSYHFLHNHPDINHTLSLYRRIYEQEYIPLKSRAKLLFAALESMLGRFRGWDNPIQLEDIILKLVGDEESTRWFKANGRKTRNNVAHGNWSEIHGDQWYTFALDIMDKLMLSYLDFWQHLTNKENRRPARAFIKYAEGLCNFGK